MHGSFQKPLAGEGFSQQRPGTVSQTRHSGDSQTRSVPLESVRPKGTRMFDSITPGQMQGTVHVAALAHVAREARWSLGAPRSYLVPSLFWVTAGQGRVTIDSEMRGFTTHNALFIPANTPHAIELTARTQGMAVFFNANAGLPCPEQALHLRLHGLGRQCDLTRMIDDIAREAGSGADDADTVLFHQSALLMHWLRRTGGAALQSAATEQAPTQTTESKLSVDATRRS